MIGNWFSELSVLLLLATLLIEEPCFKAILYSCCYSEGSLLIDSSDDINIEPRDTDREFW